jgi:hypothetical protein
MIKSDFASRPFFQTRKVAVSIFISRIYQTRSALPAYSSQRVSHIYGLSIEAQSAQEMDG